MPANPGPFMIAVSILEKFAQAMRVALAKWITSERLPKKAPSPGLRET
jgi:hypothetical protein